jgi:hypothetical protein
LEQLHRQVRQGHLLVRTTQEWDALSHELFRAYDSKDNELVMELSEPFLDAWRSVTFNLLTEPLAAAGVDVGPALHPWGIALLQLNGHRAQPLLCSLDETLTDPLEAAAVYGGLQLHDFDAVMDDYRRCLTRLLQDG